MSARGAPEVRPIRLVNQVTPLVVDGPASDKLVSGLLHIETSSGRETAAGAWVISPSDSGSHAVLYQLLHLMVVMAAREEAETLRRVLL